jgi:hypothetical protein
MMFYWLDSFAQCLSPFFHHGVGSKPHLLYRFLTFYTELIWKKYRDFFVKRWRKTTVETVF